MLEIEKSNVYVITDFEERIIRCEGGYTTPEDLTGWTKIDEGIGDRYNLCQSHYFEDGLYTEDGIPRYKLEGGQVVERSEEEIETDRAAIVQPVTPMEQMRADIDFIAAMGGIEL